MAGEAIGNRTSFGRSQDPFSLLMLKLNEFCTFGQYVSQSVRENRGWDEKEEDCSTKVGGRE